MLRAYDNRPKKERLEGPKDFGGDGQSEEGGRLLIEMLRILERVHCDAINE